MGKKSTVNRLPKAERTHPGSKITVTPAAPIPPRRTPSLPSPAATRASARPLPRLDDACIANILRHGGAEAITQALSVNTQWRRVSNIMLSKVSRLHLTRMFTRPTPGDNPKMTPLTTPRPAHVRATLRAFPHLKRLSIRAWPFEHVLPDVTAIVASVSLPVLEELELDGVYISPSTVAELIALPSLNVLILAGHDSIDNRLVSAMEKPRLQLENAAGGISTFTLDTLVFKRARNFTGKALSALSTTSLARHIIVNACDRVDVAKLTSRGLPGISPLHPSSLKSFTIHSCRNLTSVTVFKDVTCRDCEQLNFSQAAFLQSLTITTKPSQAPSPDGMLLNSDLRCLNLSGCKSLRDLIIDSPPHALFRIRFPHLKELILFGVRNLPRSMIYNAFGVDQEEPSLPNLKRLDLNGTTVDKVVLRGYTNLSTVDCSGCASLDSITVHNCWNLKTLALRGRRAPLQNVDITVSASCAVIGMRDSWSSLRGNSFQSFSYP